MSILSRALSILVLATACGGSQAADDPTVSGDADTDTDTDTDVDTDTDTDVDTATEPLQLEGYAFVDRAGVTDSVAYSGQTFRHVLIADLSSYIGRLTDRLDGGLEPSSGEIRSDLDFYLRFDSSVGGPIPHSIETSPSPVQTLSLIHI